MPIVPDVLRLPNAGKLSKRESQTLKLIAAGKSSEDIAADLKLCIKTVEFHRHNLHQKLGYSSLAELIRYAIQERRSVSKKLI